DIPPSGRGVSRFRAFGTRFGGGREQVTVLVDQERDAVGGDVLRDYDRPLPLGVVGFGDLTGGDVVHPDRSLLTPVEEATPEGGGAGLRAYRQGPQALMVRVIGVQCGLVTDDERVGDGVHGRFLGGLVQYDPFFQGEESASGGGGFDESESVRRWRVG